jgi:rare lipoprotein A
LTASRSERASGSGIAVLRQLAVSAPSSRAALGALSGLALAVLAGCAQLPARAPVAAPPPTVLPSHPPDVSQIPDAVPRYEPRSTFGNPPFYQVDGRRYTVLASSVGYVERGVASWYGTEFHGLRTATGEPYDMFAMTAAHKTLPLPCYARVTDLANGRSVIVRINDRGPFVSNRVIDLSYAAAAKLGMIGTGTAFVQIETLTPPSPLGAPVPVTTLAASAASAGPSSVPPVSNPNALPAAPSAPTVPGPIAASNVPAPAPGVSLYIQVGAFARPENARRARERLRSAGFSNVYTLAPEPTRHLERVRIGPIATVQQYDQLIARLVHLGFAGAKLAQD